MALRAALKLAKRRKLWRGDIAEVLPVGFAPSYKPRERYLLPDELDALLGELLPDYAARCAFIVATSASRGEADRARREDIDAELTRVYLRGTKTATRERTVPIVADWQRGLVKYALEHATGVDRMLGRWHNVDRDLKQACARAGIERLSQNDLRRTYSHWMRAAGMPIELIAPSMGHADTTMVQRVYGRLDANELAVRMAQALGLPESDCRTFATDAFTSMGQMGSTGSGSAGNSSGVVETYNRLRIPNTLGSSTRFTRWRGRRFGSVSGGGDRQRHTT